MALFPREGADVALSFRPTGIHLDAPAPTETQRSEFERWYLAQPRVPIMVPAEGAKVLVVKFKRLQCPSCGTSYLAVQAIFAKYEAERPGAVRWC